MGRIRPGSGARMVPGAVCAQPLSPLWGGPYAPAPGCRVRGGAGGHHGGGGLRPVRGHPVRRGLLQHRRSHDGGAVPHRRGGRRPGPVCAAPEPGGLPAVLLRGAGAHRRGAHRRPPAGRAGGAGCHARLGRTGDSLVPGLCVPGVRPVPVGVPPGAEKNRAVQTGRPATERGVAS